MAWIKKEIFNGVKYTNTLAAPIQAFHIISKPNNIWKMTIETGLQEFELIKNQISNVTPSIECDRFIQFITLNSSNIDELKKFVETISILDPSFAENQPELINRISQSSTTQDQDRSRVPGPVSRRLAIMSMSTLTRDFNWDERSEDELSEDVPSIIAPRYEWRHFPGHQNILNESNESNGIQNILNESFASSNRAPTNASTAPISANQVKITELERLSREQRLSRELPENYLCALTEEVMTTPVSAPETPDTKFEREKILHWLKTNPNNPYTRNPLNPQDLVEDLQLKQEIEKFINEEIAIQKNNNSDEMESPKKKFKR